MYYESHRLLARGLPTGLVVRGWMVGSHAGRWFCRRLLRHDDIVQKQKKIHQTYTDNTMIVIIFIVDIFDTIHLIIKFCFLLYFIFLYSVSLSGIVMGPPRAEEDRGRFS